MKIGYKLLAEAYSPQEMVRQVVRTEEAGFDFVEISDHFHPWFDSQGHSGFAWSILSAAAMCTGTNGKLFTLRSTVSGQTVLMAKRPWSVFSHSA